MTTKIIALSGDYGYINQITTTIKSIAYHNPKFKIYVINSDIPQEWFKHLNAKLSLINGSIIDLKVDPNTFIDETPTVHEHINQMAFGRLLIPDMIMEQKVLYLDSDIIVNGDLSELFAIDLKDYPLADVFETNFNSGVILFNNQKLKHDNPGITHDLLEYGRTKGLTNGDQSVLNHFFGNHYLSLPLKYNYVIGYDRDVFYFPNNAPNYYDLIKNVNHPTIIHYASNDKPWNLTSAGRMRKNWWFYYSLDWNEILLRKIPEEDNYTHFSLFTLTSSDNLMGITKLIQALPGVQFYIGSYTV